MRFFWKLMSGLIGGVIVGTLGYFVVSLALFTGSDSTGHVGPLFLGFLVLGLVLALAAPSPGKAWRRT